MADLSDVRFLTVAEVAELMRVSKMTVYRLVHAGELPAVRFGRSYRVPETAVSAALLDLAWHSLTLDEALAVTDVDEFEALMPQTVFVSATPGPYELEKSGGDVVQQVVRPTGLLDPEVEVRPVSTQVDDLLSEIRKRVAVEERVLVTTLTKRMAEDLTEYLADHEVRVRYLHSDIDTVERVEIIRDLRLGKFDVLVGINLLREGLDMPEVSLVAILDADKEGFLRSTRSLIQTIGRAARNLNGKVILYGDTITNSMKVAIEETERRRALQHAHNLEHGIVPKGLNKAIGDVMDMGGSRTAGKAGKGSRKAAEPQGEYHARSASEISKEIKRMEEQMFQHARDLEFEQAAALRDQIQRLRGELIES